MNEQNLNFKENTKKYILLVCILGTILISYFLIWNRIGNIYIEKIFNNTSENQLNLKYKNIKKSGFPFFIKFDITDLELSENKVNNTRIYSNRIFVENVMFSKKFNVFLSSISFDSENLKGEIIFDINTKTTLNINKKYKIGDVSIISDNIKIMPKDSDNIYKIKKLVFDKKLIDNDNYVNNAMSIDIKKIELFELLDDNKEELLKEFNFEASLSSILNTYKDSILSFELILNKVLLNNITDKFAIDLNGKIFRNLQTNNNDLNIDLKLGNVNNLLNSISKEDVGSKIIHTLLRNINKNEQDNEKDRYVSLKKSIGNTYIINGEDIVTLTNRILPIIQEIAKDIDLF